MTFGEADGPHARPVPTTLMVGIHLRCAAVRGVHAARAGPPVPGAVWPCPM